MLLKFVGLWGRVWALAGRVTIGNRADRSCAVGDRRAT